MNGQQAPSTRCPSHTGRCSAMEMVWIANFSMWSSEHGERLFLCTWMRQGKAASDCFKSCQCSRHTTICLWLVRYHDADVSQSTRSSRNWMTPLSQLHHNCMCSGYLSRIFQPLFSINIRSSTTSSSLSTNRTILLDPHSNTMSALTAVLHPLRYWAHHDQESHRASVFSDGFAKSSYFADLK